MYRFIIKYSTNKTSSIAAATSSLSLATTEAPATSASSTAAFLSSTKAAESSLGALAVSSPSLQSIPLSSTETDLSSSIGKSDEEIFPKPSSATYGKWIEIVETNNGRTLDSTQNLYICSNHFNITDYTSIKIKKLSPLAVPSNFYNQEKHFEICTNYSLVQPIFQQTVLPESCPSQNCSNYSSVKIFPSTSAKRKLDVSLTTQEAGSLKTIITPLKKRRIRYPGDLNISDAETVREFKTIIKKFQQNLAQRDKKIRMLRQKLYRREKKIKSMTTIIDALENKSLISENAATHLKGNAAHSVDLFQQIKNGKVNGKYPIDVRSFAITLNFYSPRAYEYVRKMYFNKLPHKRTLSKWYESIDAQPGFTLESLVALQIQIDHAKKNGSVLIVVAHKKYYGYCDIGNPFDEEHEGVIAKEALVFLVVAVNANFKIPVAYYFVGGLNATEKANIVLQVLRSLSKIDLKICSLIFDGAPNNISAAKKMGVLVEKKQFYFPHPITQEPVFVLLDICHMLKLIRNTFAQHRKFYDKDGNEIKWELLEHMENKQSLDGILLANKLKKKHLNFGTQKMKTNLAAQTLSHSVAAGLMFLKSTGDTLFNDVEGTCQFIERFNNLFDIFNSKSYGSRFKRPLGVRTKEEYFEYFDESIDYIQNLKVMNKKSQLVNILDSQSKTGYFGFKIGMTNFKKIYETYVESGLLKYISGYRFSQDHIETFFSAIRARGGFNNNPSCIQFSSAYKRLLIHNEVKASENANCITDDCAPSILTVSSSTILNDVSIKTKMYLRALENIQEYDFNLSVEQENTITYIAGYIEKSFRVFLKCVTCKKIFDEFKTVNQNVDLILYKNFGGLITPKKVIADLCIVAQKAIDIFQQTNDLTKNYFYEDLVARCFQELENEPFNDLYLDITHSATCSYNIDILTKFVFEKYLKIKLCHIGKTISEHKKPIRQQMKNLVLFSHQ